MTSISDIAAQLQVAEDVSASLEMVSAVAEANVGRLQVATRTTHAIAEALSTSADIIATLQPALDAQRALRNELRANIRNQHALFVAKQTDKIRQLEEEVGALRHQSTSLDYALIACDAEAALVKQQLASARVSLEGGDTEGGSGGSEATEEVSESEHAMFRHDSLFGAVTTIPSKDAVQSFLNRMAQEVPPDSDSRDIRTLLSRYATIPHNQL